MNHYNERTADEIFPLPKIAIEKLNELNGRIELSELSYDIDALHAMIEELEARLDEFHELRDSVAERLEELIEESEPAA
jgi:uncharacterized coiled-coil DUF342 family protein